MRISAFSWRQWRRKPGLDFTAYLSAASPSARLVRRTEMNRWLDGSSDNHRNSMAPARGSWAPSICFFSVAVRAHLPAASSCEVRSGTHPRGLDIWRRQPAHHLGSCVLPQVAYTVGWTAVSSELTYYTTLYGPEILLLLNVAYFVPSLPIMVLQTLCDSAFDRAFGVASATATRFVIGRRNCTAKLGSLLPVQFHSIVECCMPR